MGVQCSILQSIEAKSTLGGVTAAVADEEGNMWVAGNEASDFAITLRKPQSGELVDTVRPAEPPQASITNMLASDTSIWAVTSEGRALIFNSRTRRQKTSVILAAEPITSATVSSSVVYITTKTAIKLYDGSSGQCLKWWSVQHPCSGISVLSNDTVVSGHQTGNLCFWDATPNGSTTSSTGSLIKDIEGHDGEVTCLASINLSTRYHLPSVISGGKDAVIRIWNEAGAGGDSPSAELRGHSAPVRCLICVSTTLLASCSLDGRIVLWDLQALKSVGALDQHGSPLVGLSSAQSLLNSVLWSLGENESLTVWGLRHRVPEAAKYESLTAELSRKDRMLRAAHEELEKLEVANRRLRTETPPPIQERHTLPLIASSSAPVPLSPHAMPTERLESHTKDILSSLEYLANNFATEQMPSGNPFEQLSQGRLAAGEVPQEWRAVPEHLAAVQASLNDKWAALSLVDDMTIEYKYDSGPLENVVRVLRAELDHETQKVARLTTSTVSHLNNRIEDAMAQNESKDAELRDIARALSKSKTQEESLTLAHNTQTLQIEKMRIVQDQLTADLERKESEVFDLQQKLRELSDMSDSRNKINSLQNAKTQAEQQALKFQQENEELVLLLDKYRQPSGAKSRAVTYEKIEKGAEKKTTTMHLEDILAAIKQNSFEDDIRKRLGATTTSSKTQEVDNVSLPSSNSSSPPSEPSRRTRKQDFISFLSHLQIPQAVDKFCNEGRLQELHDYVVSRDASLCPEPNVGSEMRTLKTLLDTSDQNLLEGREENNVLRSQMHQTEDVLQSERLSHKHALRVKEDEVAKLSTDLQLASSLAHSANTNTAEREEALREAVQHHSLLQAQNADLSHSLSLMQKEGSLVAKNVTLLLCVLQDLSDAADIPLDHSLQELLEGADEGINQSETLPVVTSQVKLILAGLKGQRRRLDDVKADCLSVHDIILGELKRVSPSVAHSTVPEGGSEARIIGCAAANMRLLVQAWQQSEGDERNKVERLQAQLNTFEADADEAASASASQALSLRASTVGSRSNMQTPHNRASEDMLLLRQTLEAKSKEYAALQQELQNNRQRAEEKHKRIASLQELTEERSRLLQEERHRTYQLQRELQHLKGQMRDGNGRRSSERERDLEERLADAEAEIERGVRTEDSVNTLQGKLAALESTLQDVTAQTVADKEKQEHLEQRLLDSQEQVKLQQVLLASQSEEDEKTDDIKARLSQMEAQKRDLEAEVLHLTDKVMQQETQNAALQLRCDDTARELRELQGKCDDLQAAASAAARQRAATPPATTDTRNFTPPPRPATTEAPETQNATPAERSIIANSAISMSPPDPRPDLRVGMMRAQKGAPPPMQVPRPPPAGKVAGGSGGAVPQRSVQAAPPPQYAFPPRSAQGGSDKRALSPVEQKRVAMGLMQKQKAAAVGAHAVHQPPRVPVVVVASIPSPEKGRAKRYVGYGEGH